jgi:uncharacterized protein YegL
VVLVLDTSASMQGEAIRQLNAGLQQLASDLQNDPLASLRVELAVVTFGGTVSTIDVRQGRGHSIAADPALAFVTVDAFKPPSLRASGDTPMGAAVRQGLDLLRGRKSLFKEGGIPYFRPWLFLISDGAPTDTDWIHAAESARLEESVNGVSVFPIGVDRADLGTLAMFSSQRHPEQLASIHQFQALFQWLSQSLAAVANSRPGESVTLPSLGWTRLDPN